LDSGSEALISASGLFFTIPSMLSQLQLFASIASAGARCGFLVLGYYLLHVEKIRVKLKSNSYDVLIWA